MDLSHLNDSVTDPSDFPAGNLQKLDSSFRCAICKDFYDAPVVLHCGHTFCSYCIRSVLPTKPECPSCRAPAKENHLVRNTIFGEAVAAWVKARELILKYANQAARPPALSPRTKKRKLSDHSPTDSDTGQVAGPSKLNEAASERKSIKNKRSRNSGPSVTEEVISISDPEEEEVPNPPKDDAPIQCPLCSQPVLYNSINSHIDSGCKKFLVAESKDSVKPNSKAAWGALFKTPAKKPSTLISPQDREIPTTRIAKVTYGLLNLTNLRKLLSEKGLPATGDKDELIARYDRWIAIYNANLDRTQPKNVGELKESLKELEEAAHRPAPKKVDDKKWTQKHKAHFASLVEAARPKSKTEENISTSHESDSGPPSSSIEQESAKEVSSGVILIDD